MNPKDLRIIFMGTSAFAEAVLLSLLENNYNITAVFTQPDKKIGRKQLTTKTPVKIAAEKNSIPIYDPIKLDPNSINEVKNLHPDLIVVAAYGNILPKNLLVLPRLGSLNVHASLLPKYRGASPIHCALINGEKETGATIMLMDEGIDTGDIIAQKKIEIKNNAGYPDLQKKLASLSGALLLEILPAWIAGKIKPQKQNKSGTSFCPLIKKDDGKINWNDPAELIYNKYRAFMLWPGLFTHWNDRRLRLNKIGLSKDEQAEIKEYKIGQVFKNNGTICVKASQGSVILDEIQLEGKSPAAVNSFINGYPNFIGSILK